MINWLVFKVFDLINGVWYWFCYTYSWAKYLIRMSLIKSQDRLDYFEVMRFQLWNSVVSNDSSGSQKLKVIAHGYTSSQIRIHSSYFTKFRLKAEPYLPVRVIAWDRGVDSNSLETRLVQAEYYLSVAKIVDKVEFQTYVLDNYPKRYMFSKLWYQDVSFSPNFTPWSQFIYSRNSILWFLYVFSFILIFFALLVLESIYLGFCLFSLRFKFSSSVFTNSFNGGWYNIYASALWVAATLGFPIFYVFYLVAILGYIILTLILGCLYAGYISISKYMFKLGWKILVNLDKYVYDPSSSLYIWITSTPLVEYIQFFLLRFGVYMGTKWNVFIRRHWFIHMSIYYLLRTARVLGLICGIIGVSAYFNFHLLFAWFANYFVAFVLGLEYEGLVDPLLFSFVSLYSLVILFPNFSRFIRIPEAVATASSLDGMTFVDRQAISNLSVEFYKAMSNEELPSRLNRWSLANEVLSLKYMAKEDSFGSNIDKSRDLGYQLFEISENRTQKLKVLADYFRAARESITTEHISEFDLTRLSDSDTLYRGQLDDSTVILKFLPDEFQFLQSNLTRMYYFMSTDFSSLSSLSSRVALSYYPGLRDTHPDLENPYESEFIFRRNFSDLYMRRIAEFSKVSKSRYFFRRVSSRFVSRDTLSLFSELPLTVKRSLDRLVNAQVSPIWSPNCVTTLRSWRFRAKEYPTRRSFDNSQNFFDSNFSLGLSNWSQSKLHNLIDRSNRNSYINTSMYFQFQYDTYWVFKLTTNVFVTYPFEPTFYFAAESFKLPFWLFRNPLPGSATHVAHQDDVGSIYTHTLFLPYFSTRDPTVFRAFYDVLTNISKFGYRHYNQYLLLQFDLESNYHGGGVDITDPSTFSRGFSDWADKIVFESVAKDRVLVNKMVAEYLYKDLNIISKGAMGDFQNLRANYFYQSFYSTYLQMRTSAGFSRYVVKGREKFGNFGRDVIELFKHLVYIHTEDDLRKMRTPVSKKHAIAFERIYIKKQKFINRIKAVFRIFPSIRASGFDTVFALFIAGAYIYTDYSTWPLQMRTLLDEHDAAFQPKEGDELWGFFMDFLVFILYWVLTWI